MEKLGNSPNELQYKFHISASSITAAFSNQPVLLSPHLLRPTLWLLPPAKPPNWPWILAQNSALDHHSHVSDYLNGLEVDYKISHSFELLCGGGGFLGNIHMSLNNLN